MNDFEVKFQLVDSPVDKSVDAGVCTADLLVDRFRRFPFADEIQRAASMESPTFPTISFIRRSDGEEIDIWTDNGRTYDVCLVKRGRHWFSNSKPRAEIETMLNRFATESVETISPPSLWRRIFGLGRAKQHVSGD